MKPWRGVAHRWRIREHLHGMKMQYLTEEQKNTAEIARYWFSFKYIMISPAHACTVVSQHARQRASRCKDLRWTAADPLAPSMKP
jgi:hypothetical protein